MNSDDIAKWADQMDNFISELALALECANQLNKDCQNWGTDSDFQKKVDELLERYKSTR